MKFHTLALQFLVASEALRFGVRAFDRTSDTIVADAAVSDVSLGINNLRVVVDPVTRSKTGTMDHTVADAGVSDVLLETPVDSDGRFSPSDINNLRVDSVTRGDGSSSKTGTMHHTVADAGVSDVLLNSVTRGDGSSSKTGTMHHTVANAGVSDVLLETPVDSDGRFSPSDINNLRVDSVTRGDGSSSKTGTMHHTVADAGVSDVLLNSVTRGDGSSSKTGTMHHTVANAGVSDVLLETPVDSGGHFSATGINNPHTVVDSGTRYDGSSSKTGSMHHTVADAGVSDSGGRFSPSNFNNLRRTVVDSGTRYDGSSSKTGSMHHTVADAGVSDILLNSVTRGDGSVAETDISGRFSPSDIVNHHAVVAINDDDGISSFTSTDGDTVSTQRKLSKSSKKVKPPQVTTPPAPAPSTMTTMSPTSFDYETRRPSVTWFPSSDNFDDDDAGFSVQVVGLLQGLLVLQVGVNALNGRINYDRNSPISKIFDFEGTGDFATNLNDYTSIAFDEHLDARQAYYLRNIMNVNKLNQCSESSASYADFSATFESTLEEASKSYGGGYYNEADVEVSVPIGPAEAGIATTVTTAAQFGKSKASTDYKSRALVGETRTFNQKYTARFYEVTLDTTLITAAAHFSSSFVTDVLELEKLRKIGDFRDEARAFFNKFGTHFRDRSVMGALRERSAYFTSSTTEEEMYKVSQATQKAGLSFLGFSAGSDSTSNSETYTTDYASTQTWLTETYNSGGSPSAEEGEFCESAYIDTRSQPIEQRLVPIYELFDKIDAVDGTLLKETTQDYLSEFLYPTKGNVDDPKSCRCYQTDLFDTIKQCAGSLTTMQPSRSVCEYLCNKDSRCQSDGSYNRIDAVFGELESCKWDANAACTWNNQEGRPDCVENCVCLIESGSNTETCRFPLTYGEPYHLQLVLPVSSGLRRWLTNSRRGKNTNSKPSTGYGDYARTEDCAHKGGIDACTSNGRVVDPDQYRWIIRSDESDGSRFDEDGQVIGSSSDPMKEEGKCIKYGDIIYLQGAGQDNHWLTGGRGRGNEGVYMADTAAEGFWIVRSATIRNRSTLDPRHRQCIRTKDQVYFQASNLDDRYLSGGRNKGNWDVYTKPIAEASLFEMRADTDVTGRLTTEAADPPTLPAEN